MLARSSQPKDGKELLEEGQRSSSNWSCEEGFEKT